MPFIMESFFWVMCLVKLCTLCHWHANRRNTAVLSDNISKVVPNVTIKDVNAAAICPCVGELMI